ncbi:MAG: KH domain-containing protein [bacterium]|nr:KH domain-containing protein [bacterium]
MSDITPEVQFLEQVVKLIVVNADAVEISRTVDDLGVLITLKVDKEDMGRIIGKDGQTAKALRTLLRAIGSRHEQRINMKILEPEGEEFSGGAESSMRSKTLADQSLPDQKPATPKGTHDSMMDDGIDL